MIESALLAWALVAGVPWPMLLAVVAAWVMPWPSLAVTAVVVSASLRGRPGLSDGEAAVMVGIAAELKAGQSLRGAIVAAATGESLAPVRRLALAGVPIADVAELLAKRVGGDRWMTRAVLTVADRTGGSTATAFEQLAAHSLARQQLRRERRSAAAPALLEALLVGGIPLALVISRLVRGDLSGRGGFEVLVIAAGAVMVTGGSALVAWMVWRAVR
jgi:hypothetical protein